MAASAEQKFVTVARILRSRGNKGEVAAELLTDFPERLPQIGTMHLQAASGTRRSAELRSFWVDRNHPGQAVFHFAGVNSIDDAEKLRGLDVQIPFEQRAMLPSGSYFVTDLIGCSVFELLPDSAKLASSPCSLAQAPALLGQVRDVYFPGEGQPGTPLLAVASANSELLIPLAADICKSIDPVARRIEVALPEGLRSLNTAPSTS